MSIEAMKMALEAFELLDRKGGLGLDVHEYIRTKIKALRQAIEEAEKQEPLILDRGCYERGCIAYDERDGDGVNMKQERVDETAKGEHETWPSVQCTCGGTIYFKHTKREWVGLTDEDKDAFWRADQMTSKEWDELFAAGEAKLKEKNS